MRTERAAGIRRIEGREDAQSVVGIRRTAEDLSSVGIGRRRRRILLGKEDTAKELQDHAADTQDTSSFAEIEK